MRCREVAPSTVFRPSAEVVAPPTPRFWSCARLAKASCEGRDRAARGRAFEQLRTHCWARGGPWFKVASNVGHLGTGIAASVMPEIGRKKNVDHFALGTDHLNIMIRVTVVVGAKRTRYLICRGADHWSQKRALCKPCFKREVSVGGLRADLNEAKLPIGREFLACEGMASVMDRGGGSEFGLHDGVATGVRVSVSYLEAYWGRPQKSHRLKSVGSYRNKANLRWCNEGMPCEEKQVDRAVGARYRGVQARSLS